MEISAKEFMRMQPNTKKVTEVEKFYMLLATKLTKHWDESGRFSDMPDTQREAVVLAVVGYFQDVVTDAGIWRSFTMMHEHLYGTPLPFYGRSDDYIDYELNRDDLRFIIWYALEGQHYKNFNLSPLDADIGWLADEFHQLLDEVYETAPEAIEYNMKAGVDPEDVEDANSIFELSTWLFYHCYLLKHASKIAIAKAHLEARDIYQKEGAAAAEKIQDLYDRVMLSQPCGPLALPIGEWVQMVATGELPKKVKVEKKEIHHLYTDFVKANGKEIAFFKDYEALVSFLTCKMGWEQEEGGVLPNLKAHANFVILANKEHGILIAPNVAQFVAMEGNTLYNKALASQEAHTLVTEPGRCPADLIRYLFNRGLLPDAKLPADESGTILHDNWDFLARLYQQEFYTSAEI
ncbi:MAG: DUF3843 family protein [Muribaculaceae bacterium]|nr:DUF3843 family protein [Muribaculaceae bacterium]